MEGPPDVVIHLLPLAKSTSSCSITNLFDQIISSIILFYNRYLSCCIVAVGQIKTKPITTKRNRDVVPTWASFNVT